VHRQWISPLLAPGLDHGRSKGQSKECVVRWIVIAGIGLVVLLLLIWVVSTYNRLVRQRQQVRSAGGQVDVQLKRRHDLIPNVVETVKGYAAHERGTLEAVVAARQQAVEAESGGRAEQARAEGALTRSLGRLFALAEAYPDLKANQNFLALQTELSSTEDKLAYARQFLNTAVQTLNTTVESFPSNLVAGLTGFRQAEFFEVDEAESGPVRVQF
jgi:LemA protein